jgi:hypothetical protein
MKVISARGLRLAVSALAIVGLFVAVNAIPGSATSSTGGLTSTPLARGNDQDPGTIPIKQGMDVALVRNDFPVGATSGWHSHPGGAVGVVKEGQITLYRQQGNGCVATTYTVNQSFIERPSDVLNGVNAGTVPAVVYVMFPSVPAGGATRIDQPAPADCQIAT